MGERKTLEACFESMQKGFAGTVDQLADHLAEVCGAKIKIVGRVDFAEPRASYSQERAHARSRPSGSGALSLYQKGGALDSVT